jgi:hypothetical protein
MDLRAVDETEIVETRVIAGTTARTTYGARLIRRHAVRLSGGTMANLTVCGNLYARPPADQVPLDWNEVNIRERCLRCAEELGEPTAMVGP